MGWDEFESAGIHGMTGDKPVEELSAALQRIRRAYEEQFARRPTVAELLHAFETALRANPREVDDAQRLAGGHLDLVGGELASAPIEVDNYEGAYTDRHAPGYFLVEHRKTRDEVIRVSRLVVVERVLEIDFEIWDDRLDEMQARRLIRIALLRDLFDNSYAGEADEIHWHDLASGREETTPYSVFAVGS